MLHHIAGARLLKVSTIPRWGAFLHRLGYLAILLVAAAFLGGCPKSSNEYSAGRKAENIQDYDTALVHYERALREDPQNSEYKLRAERMRYEAAINHIKLGQVARRNGDLQLALGEFQKAQLMDPSNAAADQEVRKTMEMIAQAAAGAPHPLIPLLKSKTNSSQRRLN